MKLTKTHNLFKWPDYIYYIFACLGIIFFVLATQVIVSTAIAVYANPSRYEWKIMLAFQEGKGMMPPRSEPTFTPLRIDLSHSPEAILSTQIMLEDTECKDWDELSGALATRIKALASTTALPIHIQIYGDGKVPMQALITAMDVAMEFQDKAAVSIRSSLMPITEKEVREDITPITLTDVFGHILKSGVIAYIIIGLGIIMVIFGMRALGRKSGEIGYWDVNTILLTGILAVALSLLGVFTCLMSMFGHIKAKMNPDEGIMLGYLSRLFVIAFEGFAVAAIAFSLYWYLLRRGTSCHRGTEDTEKTYSKESVKAG